MVVIDIAYTGDWKDSLFSREDYDDILLPVCSDCGIKCGEFEIEKCADDSYPAGIRKLCPNCLKSAT